MKATTIEASFSEFYLQKKGVHLYPTEFVIRAFLGNYPRLKLDKNAYKGACILDLGYGDGRNMPLLHNMGLEIYGVEVDERMNRLAAERLKGIGINADLRVGYNNQLPFDDAFFDYILASSSCYYIQEGTTFTDNLNEIARVMKKGAVFVFSIPTPDNFILKDAEDLGAGHWRIKHDPFGLRNGTIFRAFSDEVDITSTLSEHFADFSIGSFDDNFWGLHIKGWAIVCKKR